MMFSSSTFRVHKKLSFGKPRTDAIIDHLDRAPYFFRSRVFELCVFYNRDMKKDTVFEEASARSVFGNSYLQYEDLLAIEQDKRSKQWIYMICCSITLALLNVLHAYGIPHITLTLWFTRTPLVSLVALNPIDFFGRQKQWLSQFVTWSSSSMKQWTRASQIWKLITFSCWQSILTYFLAPQKWFLVKLCYEQKGIESHIEYSVLLPSFERFGQGPHDVSESPFKCYIDSVPPSGLTRYTSIQGKWLNFP